MNDFACEYAELLKQTIISPTDSFDDKYTPLEKLIQDNAPKALFRFRPCDKNNIDAFWRDRAFHNIPENFNDPHDCLVYFDKAKIENDIDSTVNIETLLHLLPNISKDFFMGLGLPQELEDVLTGKIDFDVQKACEDDPTLISSAASFFKLTADNLINRVKEYIRTTPKIACFSSDINSVLMWSYYADSHRGFALGYDFAKLQSKCLNCSKKKCDDYAETYLMPIVYSDERYDATALSGAFYTTAIANNLNLHLHIDIELPDRLGFRKANLYKGNAWQHEKEWRSFLYSQNPKINHAPIAPTSLYLGCEISPIHEKVLVQLAYEKGMKTVYKMKVIDDERGFRLGVDTIELDPGKLPE